MKSIFKEDEPAQPENIQTVIKFTPILDSLEKLKKIAEEPKEVSNLDEIKLHLRTELKIVTQAIEALVKAIKIPDEIKVSNFPVQKEITIPDTIQVANLSEITQQIEGLRALINSIDFKPQIEVSTPEVRIPEVRIPPFPKIPAPNIDFNPEIKIDLDRLLTALTPLKYLSDKAGKPLSVRLSDGERFVQALKALADKQERVVQAFATTSPGLTIDELKHISGMTFETFDYISAAYPDLVTEIYTYKSGGVGGKTTGTISVVYSDATKENLLSVTKS